MNIMDETKEKSPLTAKFSSDVTSKLSQSQNSRVNYFKYEVNELHFPPLHFNKEYVPAGNSQPYCLHFEWNNMESFRQIDQYKHVQGLPKCEQADNSKGLWNPGDPKEGINLFAFKQIRSDPGLLGSCESDAIKIKLSETLPARCYSYEFLSGVCITVRYKEGEQQGSWEYVKGCFADGQPVEYRKAEPGKDYAFNNVRFEVR